MLLALFFPPERPIFYQLHPDHWNALYQWTTFDISILAAYLTVLGILAIYGVHRYHLVFLYLKNKHKVATPKGRFENLPLVTVQLPVAEPCADPSQPDSTLIGVAGGEQTC